MDLSVVVTVFVGIAALYYAHQTLIAANGAHDFKAIAVAIGCFFSFLFFYGTYNYIYKDYPSSDVTSKSTTSVTTTHLKTERTTPSEISNSSTPLSRSPLDASTGRRTVASSPPPITPAPPIEPDTTSITPTPPPPRSTSQPASLQMPAIESLSDLKRQLGETQGMTRYYAIQKDIKFLPGNVSLSATDAMDLLRGISEPAPRHEMLSALILPRLALPLSSGDAITLLDSMSRSNRRDLLQRLAPCIERPVADPQLEELIGDVLPIDREDISISLQGPLSCLHPNAR